MDAFRQAGGDAACTFAPPYCTHRTHSVTVQGYQIPLQYCREPSGAMRRASGAGFPPQGSRKRRGTRSSNLGECCAGITTMNAHHKERSRRCRSVRDSNAWGTKAYQTAV